MASQEELAEQQEGEEVKEEENKPKFKTLKKAELIEIEE